MKKIHMIGIGGVGMAALAALLKARGHDVSGCDLKATPRTRWLESLGIRVAFGHDPAHLHGVDEVVATPAVAEDEPERVAARNVRMRGDVLAEIVSEADSVAVCGSHGKTTTATWTAKLLRALGEDPSWAIGGETGDFPVAGVGRGPLVVEADESDGTLAKYRAGILVVTNCEYDHPDHFKTREDYFACYDAARRQARDVVEAEGLVPVEGLASVLAGLPPHNRRNARAAVEVALRRGHSIDDIAKALPPIIAELPDRRFQFLDVELPEFIRPSAHEIPGFSNAETQRRRGAELGMAAATHPAPKARSKFSASLRLCVSALKETKSPKPSFITDYAHHPTEMACAVRMARDICGRKLCVLFQPHRHSRTKALLDEFPAAFAEADQVVLCPTYAAFERPVEGGDVADLYAACRGKVRDVRLARSCEEAWTHAVRSARLGDVVLVLGAGDIVSKLKIVPPRVVWIGAGSNTWRSDLDLGVEYRRTQGPADRPGATLGIPWMAGIPGTMGGWVKMNAGAFGHSISEVVSRVKVDGAWVDAAECGFGYRTSSLSGEIQDVEWDPARLAAARADGRAEDYLARRRKFPPGTFGSFFKNPPGDSAGRLLESVGAKGMRVGGAHVWDEHANVIVRGEGATPSDVLALAKLMRNRVLFRLGVSLEPEVCGL